MDREKAPITLNRVPPTRPLSRERFSQPARDSSTRNRFASDNHRVSLSSTTARPASPLQPDFLADTGVPTRNRVATSGRVTPNRPRDRFAVTTTERTVAAFDQQEVLGSVQTLPGVQSASDESDFVSNAQILSSNRFGHQLKFYQFLSYTVGFLGDD